MKSIIKNKFISSKFVLFFIFLFLFSLNSIQAEEFGYNYLEGDLNIQTAINYSQLNVNNSQYLRGYSPTTLRDWFEGYFDGIYYDKTNPSNFWNDTYATFNKTYADTLYCQLTGCTMSGNITAQNGFFTYLGSLTNKIIKIFSQEIETENLNVTNKIIIKDNVTSNYTEMYSYNGTFYIDLY